MTMSFREYGDKSTLPRKSLPKETKKIHVKRSSGLLPRFLQHHSKPSSDSAIKGERSLSVCTAQVSDASLSDGEPTAFGSSSLAYSVATTPRRKLSAHTQLRYDLSKCFDYTNSLLRQTLTASNRHNLCQQLRACAQLICDYLTSADNTSQKSKDLLPSDAWTKFNSAVNNFNQWLDEIISAPDIGDTVEGKGKFAVVQAAVEELLEYLNTSANHCRPISRLSCIRQSPASDDQAGRLASSLRLNLSLKDRQLVTQLKRLEEDNPVSPPPKPPLPPTEEDSGLKAYLDELAANITPSPTSSQPAAQPQLTSSPIPDFPLADDSDAEDEQQQSGITLTTATVGVHKAPQILPSTISVSSKLMSEDCNRGAERARMGNDPLPPLPSVALDLDIITAHLGQPITGPQTLSPSGSFTTISATGCVDDLLRDEEMQEEIAAVAHRVQSKLMHPDTVSRSLTLRSALVVGGVELDCTSQTASELQSFKSDADSDGDDAVADDTDGPLVQSDVKSDTEEIEEIFEINGKKYRQTFQKHTVVERHKIRQIVYAPARPDGSGPLLPPCDGEDELKAIATCRASFGERDMDLDMIAAPAFDTARSTSSPLDPTAAEQQRQQQQVLYEAPDTTVADTLAVAATGPQKPPAPTSSKLQPLTNYMYRFGMSEFGGDPTLDKRLSSHIFDFFRSQWHKTETQLTPHERSKTISYVQRYSQPTPSGGVVHRSTCVQETRSVRLRSGRQLYPSGASSCVSATCGAATDTRITSGPESSDAATPAAQNLLLTIKTFRVSVPRAPDAEPTGSPQQPQPSLQAQSLDWHSDEFGSVVDQPENQEKEDEGTAPLIPAIGANMHEEPLPIDVVHSRETAESAVATCTKNESGVLHTVSRIPSTIGTPESDRGYVTSGDSSRGSWSSVLEEMDATPYLVISEVIKEDEITIQGGCIDALIVHVTSIVKPTTDYFLFFETFLFTYRTFMTSDDLIDRLLARYHLFRLASGESSIDAERDKVCSNVVSFLINVVAQLKRDLTSDLVKRLAIFHDRLVADGEERIAALLLSKVQSQLAIREEVQRRPSSVTFTSGQQQAASPSGARSHLSGGAGTVTTRPATLLEIPSQVVAEQMTLLEAVKLDRLELPELLNIKNLERGEGLGVAECAAHFASVTRWAQTLLLSPVTDRDRERNAGKLLDIMDQLFELKNFSSYLALMCAFAGIPDTVFSRKTRTKLSRMAAFMQPPHFTQYRQALELAGPPLIPYLGLTLQHLIHLGIGNPLYLDPPPAPVAERYSAHHGPIINFWRCWKHFLIISYFVKREKIDPSKSRYQIKANDEVLAFLNNFQDVLPDSHLQLLSTQLKTQAS